MADINIQTKQVLDKKEITNPTKIFSEENKAKEVVKEPTCLLWIGVMGTLTN